MHIGFLFNHRYHQVYHTISIAFELSSAYPDTKVTALVANRENFLLIKELAKKFPEQKVDIVQAHIPAILALSHKLLKKIFSVEKLAVTHFNDEIFSKFDALVVPESTSLNLRKNKKLHDLKLIRVPHGAGDREIAVDSRLSKFDLLLLPGKKTLARLDKLDRLPIHGNFEIIGYPKFDLIDPDSRISFFNNDKPVVLYNPHFSPGLSSWHGMGKPVLEFFINNNDYNLLFAPHIKLYEHRHKYRFSIPRHYFNQKNIIIDTGSIQSSDMSYTYNADLYIGDVSSQIYEFLIRPRPCIFLNSHKVRWQDNPYYSHWYLGEVIDNPDKIAPAIDNAWNLHGEYFDRQKQAVSDTFDLNEISSSMRAARAIVDYMHKLDSNSISNTGNFSQ